MQADEKTFNTEGVSKLLVTGERRSGTTLLANFLNSQDGIKINRDFLHIHRMMPGVGVSSINNPLSQKQNEILKEQFSAWNSVLGITVDMPDTDFSSMVEFYNYILGEIHDPGNTIVGHKSTMAHGIVGELLLSVPDLKIVYIVRDPRDVVVSANKMWPNGAETIFDFIDNWRSSITAMLQYLQQKVFSSRIFILRFEDLILESENQIGLLSDFLGMDLITPTRLNEYNNEWDNNSSFADLGKKTHHTVFNSKPIGRWRSANMAIGRITEVLLAEEMQEVGYKPSSEVSAEEKVFVSQKLRLGALHYRNVQLQQQQQG